MATGCTEPKAGNDVVAEGILHSVTYAREDGGVGGMTRLNLAEAVPGGNGSFNVDAYGKLTRDFLIISYPDKKGLDSHIIPVHNLKHVQFGDAGRPVLRKES